MYIVNYLVFRRIEEREKINKRKKRQKQQEIINFF